MSIPCDCHVHLYDMADERWGRTAPAILRAGIDDYEELSAKLGTRRTVVVQPLLYGHDNAFLLAMLERLGSARSRGIAIARPGLSDGELDQLRHAGVIGLRFFVGSALRPTSDVEVVLAEMTALDARLCERGMHFQINTHGSFLRTHSRVFERFSAGIVFDHLGHVIPQASGYVGLPELIELARRTGARIKVSGLYLDSRAAPSSCGDMADAIRQLAGAVPQQLVWGTNWPHPTVHELAGIPDDVALFTAVRRWLPDEAAQRSVLSMNAAKLYGFEPHV